MSSESEWVAFLMEFDLGIFTKFFAQTRRDFDHPSLLIFTMKPFLL